MKRVLLILGTVLAIASCGNNTAKQEQKAQEEQAQKEQREAERAKLLREQFVRDSLKREQEIKDSIARAATIAKLAPSFNIKKDEFSSTSWVEPKSAPKYRNRNGVYCYFSTVDGDATINFRFVVQYYDDDWLFIRNMIFNIDGEENITITPDMERDNGSGYIWEWCDVNVNSNTAGINESFIKKIANAKTVKIKFNGSQYYDTRTLTAEQIKAIKNTYDYYLALGGRFI